MATLKELRDERLRKLSEIRRLGIDPYPAKLPHKITHEVSAAKKDFKDLEGQKGTLAGRVVNIRKFGKLAFVVIKGGLGPGDTFQFYIKQDTLKPLSAEQQTLGLEQLGLLDAGDFVLACGQFEKTQSGEESLLAEELYLLAKSLRPLPTTPDGLANKEERLRRRYVDINVNQAAFDRFVRRSKFWQATREFLVQHGFLEINVPVLEHTTGGADAAPFVTHMDALDQDFYLRISHELPLKKLLGAGYERVFDIGPRFRNENYSDEHLPEHVAMEWYAAYQDWRDGMAFMTEMYRHVLKATFGTLQFKLGKFEVNLSENWRELDYAETIQERYGLDVFNCTDDEVKRALKDNKLEVENTDNKARAVDKLWKNIRKDIAGPVWLVNAPLFISPLAKVNPERSETVQRFQAVIAGSELGNGFSELNDPLDQLQRFKEQQSLREHGDKEAMMLDIDYIEMLEYGMPPACGWGWSERVFWTFEGVSAREGVPFPQLRQDIDATTKKLYPGVKL